jgi:hypothetical protein
VQEAGVLVGLDVKGSATGLEEGFATGLEEGLTTGLEEGEGVETGEELDGSFPPPQTQHAWFAVAPSFS